MGITVLFAVFTIGFHAYKTEIQKKELALNSLKLFVTFTILLIPIAYPLLDNFFSSDFMVYHPISFLGVSSVYSLDVAGPFIPNWFNPYVREGMSPLLQAIGRPPYDSLIPLGYTLLLECLRN